MKKRKKGNVHFVLDEFAAVGHLESIDQALGIGRGYGIRLLFVLQSLSQAKKNFPDGQEHTLISNTSQVFFAVNDLVTATEMVSNRLGDQTIVLESGGTNRGASHSYSRGGHQHSTEGSSGGSNSNWSLRERKLLKPEEVLALPHRTAITFAAGVPWPIRTTLVRYYEEPKLFRQPGWLRHQWRAIKALFVAAVVCAVMLYVAAQLTSVVDPISNRQVPVRPDPDQVYDQGVPNV